MKVLIALFLVALFSLPVSAATVPCGTNPVTSGDWVMTCPDVLEEGEDAMLEDTDDPGDDSAC